MRKLAPKFFYLLIIGIIISSCAGTKDLAPDGSEIPHNVNTIIIHTDELKDTAYQNIGSHLIQRGYTIENSSPEFYTVSTEFKSASQKGSDMATDVSLSASVVEQNNETQILLNGKLRQGMKTGLDLGESTIEHYGQSGSLIRVAWDELYRVARAYSDSLSFETR